MQKPLAKIKAFKFQYDVTIEKIDLAITFPCQMSVIWKRGQKQNKRNALIALHKANQKHYWKKKKKIVLKNFSDKICPIKYVYYFRGFCDLNVSINKRKKKKKKRKIYFFFFKKKNSNQEWGKFYRKMDLIYCSLFIKFFFNTKI